MPCGLRTPEGDRGCVSIPPLAAPAVLGEISGWVGGWVVFLGRGGGGEGEVSICKMDRMLVPRLIA